MKRFNHSAYFRPAAAVCLLLVAATPTETISYQLWASEAGSASQHSTTSDRGRRQLRNPFLKSAVASVLSAAVSSGGHSSGGNGRGSSGHSGEPSTKPQQPQAGQQPQLPLAPHDSSRGASASPLFEVTKVFAPPIWLKEEEASVKVRTLTLSPRQLAGANEASPSLAAQPPVAAHRVCHRAHHCFRRQT